MVVSKSGSKRRPIIVLEFNELVPRLMERFIGEGHLPNFQALRDAAHVFTSDTIDHGTEVEPWIQYPSAHTGVRAHVHQLVTLAQGNKYTGPRYWDVASQHGLRIMLWSSMNIGLQPGFQGIVLPDPWASDTVTPQPAELMPFVTYIQKNVQEHTRKSSAVTRSETVKFLAFIATHGLRWRTASALLRQLWEERSGRYRWRRALVLDRIVTDTFCHFYRRQRPELATLFLNSTAFVQHRYWRNMEPQHFEKKPSEAEQQELGTAVLQGYKNMDAIVAQVRALAPAATIILCTAHSQQPHLAHEKVGGKISFRPIRFDRFVQQFGIEGVQKVEPVMTEQFRLHFASERELHAAQTLLKSAQLAGEPVFNMRREDNALYCGCRIHHAVAQGASVEFGTDTLTTLDFFDVFYLIEAVKSGRHHPDGILWISTPGQHRIDHPDSVPLTSLAPTILDLLDLPIPQVMTEPPLQWVPEAPKREPALRAPAAV